MAQATVKIRKTIRLRDILLRLAALSVAVSVCVVIFAYREYVTALGEYGYLGAFLVSVISSAAVVVPVPGLVIIFALGAVLNPWLVGLVSGLGSTLGETSGYLLGYSGRGVIENTGLYRRVEGWVRRRGPVALFLLAIIPNPVFDIAGAAAGAVRMPFWKFLVYGGAGRTIKHTLFALAGAWGMGFVAQLL
ncbi:MAG: hypothetical protein A2147_01850 [Chloroflexi bacterium RBG_16_57_8]|nr:MAG: hypothetical protein A2147_01850 [Chloroflexi bacterium RBG_16_57_8]